MKQRITVAKFGGTSLADYGAMARSARIVAADPDTRLVVVSATAGTTNLLMQLTRPGGTADERKTLVRSLCARHRQILDQVPGSPALTGPFGELTDALFDTALATRHPAEPAIRDALLAFGELISSLLFAQVLREQGIPAVWKDAREVLRTDSAFGRAEPRVPDIRELVEARWTVAPAAPVVVTQGFIGADARGRTTTLGRGGSDYSAALLAEALGADRLNIWTDVPGLYSADPRIVADARPISEISFAEAAELATYGAKVLHPATLWPAVRSDIRVFIGCSREPGLPGTHILPVTGNRPLIRALSVRRRQTLLTVQSLDMFRRHGFLARIFGTLARYGISVDLVTTGEVSVALTLDNLEYAEGRSPLPAPMLEELRSFCTVTVETGLALVALVGNNLNHSPGVSGELFHALRAYNIRLICHGASQHNLCFLAAEEHAEEIARSLHRVFLTGTATIHARSANGR